MTKEEKFLIPIDDAIEAFRHHLDAHDRTILSARFGDGKSFFLSHFMENDNDEPLLVNVDNIIWVRPYKGEEGSMIYVKSQGKNDYPVSLCVKESYIQVTNLILR